jgi:hypothetical protein
MVVIRKEQVGQMVPEAGLTNISLSKACHVAPDLSESSARACYVA